MGDSDKSPVSWQVEAIKTLGFPVVFSSVILWMLWTAGAWTGTQILLPLFNKQSAFIDSATKMTGSMQTTTTEINTTLQAHGKNAEEQAKTYYEAIAESTKTNTDLIKQNQELLRTLTTGSERQLDVLERIEDNTSNRPK